MAKQTVLVAINQLQPKPNNAAANFNALESTVVQNARDGAKLSVFPEFFIYGYGPLQNRDELIKAARCYGVNLKRFQKIAKDNSIAIIPGTIPSLDENKLYNTSVYIDARGEVLTKYSKNNLWISDRKKYSPGLKTPEVFNSVLGKTAIIICWDIFDHRLFTSAVVQNAEWIIIVSCWTANQSLDKTEKTHKTRNNYPGFSDSKALALDTLIQSRVSEYNAGIVYCNFGGQYECSTTGTPDVDISAGCSQVISPFLTVHGRIMSNKPNTLLCEVKDIKKDIEDFEINYGGRRKDVVAGYPWAAGKSRRIPSGNK